MIINLYVDNILIFRTKIEIVRRTKKFLHQQFDIKDLGVINIIFVIKVLRNLEEITSPQSHYITKTVQEV